MKSVDGRTPRPLALTTLGGAGLRDAAPGGLELLPSGGRNLLLLCYLALSTRSCSRDHLTELLWEDVEPARARHSLRTALSSLRTVVGPRAIGHRSDLVSLTKEHGLIVDAHEFADAERSGDSARAVALYDGAFLAGNINVEGNLFHDWVTSTRTNLATRFARVCQVECQRLADIDDWAASAAVARRWLESAPLDGAAAIALLRSLAAPDTPEALHHAIDTKREIGRRLHRDYEVPLDPAVDQFTERLIRRLSIRQQPRSSTEDVEAPVRALTNAPVVLATAPTTFPVADARTSRRGSRVARLAVGIAVGTAVAAGIMLWRPTARFMTGPAPAASVTRVRMRLLVDVTAAPTDSGGYRVRDDVARLLSASLERERVVQVVSRDRRREVVTTGSVPRVDGSPSDAELQQLAADVGATMLLSGNVSHASERWMLDFELRDATTGARRRHVTVQDADLLRAVSRVTASLMGSFDQLGEVETASVVAYRAFARGRVAVDRAEWQRAAQAFDVAIAEDSQFVSAIVARRRLLGSARTVGSRDSARRLDYAWWRERDRAPVFDRLEAEVTRAAASGEHARAVRLAERLVAEFPNDLRAYRLLISTLFNQGQLARSSAALKHALTLASDQCGSHDLPCERFLLSVSLAQVAGLRGDAQTALDAAHRAVQLQPDEALGWSTLAGTLLAAGSVDSAMAATAEAARLDPRSAVVLEGQIWLALRARRYAAADSMIARMRVGATGQNANQVRDLAGALASERGQIESAARRYADIVRDSPGERATLGLVLGSRIAQLGTSSAAESAFVRAIRATPPSAAGIGGRDIPYDTARAFAWTRTLLAEGLYMSGARDTARLRILADSIETIGARSGFSRDWRLHRHVRGLIAASMGHWHQAAVHFEQAQWGLSGWSRTSLELAKAYAADGRTADAVNALRATRFAPLGGIDRYVTRSELDAWTAELLISSGQRDSAAVYVARVRSAWGVADAPQRDWLSRLESSLVRANNSYRAR